MASLTTYFLGICTHIQDFAGVAHRCVLVNGLVPANLNGKQLATHMPTLILNANDIVGQPTMRLPDPGIGNLIVLELGGVALRIGNANPVPPNGLNYTDAYKTGIPSLSQTTELSPLSVSMIDGRNSWLASCYFDVDSGTFDAGKTVFESAIAILTSDLNDDFALLTGSSFVWGEGTIKLRAGAEIVVANVGVGPYADSPFDFLLHYNIFEQFPAKPFVPTILSSDLQVRAPHTIPLADDVGPGCSNSNYP
jgi:hypothetical protein